MLALRDLPGEYSFATLFSQRLDVGVRLVRDGEPVAETRTPLEVYDVAQMGSLYERIVDAARRCPTPSARSPGLSHAYHPWFPVLLIGAHKAELYTRALVGDIVHKRRNLADPGWLVRVGLYLELLTALGIIEGVDPSVLQRRGARGVRDQRGLRADPAPHQPGALGARSGSCARSRSAAARAPGRSRSRTCWPSAARRCSSCTSTTRTCSRRSRSPGPNPHSAQETWHRVFRDAERAVLRQTPDAFPELADLPVEVRKFVLWHRRGNGSAVLRVPGPLPKLLGDQDGLFGAACNQYRDSMNQVADWARAQGLMDYTGEEAIPRGVSLFEAHLYQPSRVALLQRRDGYDADRIEVGAELPERATSRRCACSPSCWRAPRRSRSCARTRSRCSPARRGR